MNMGVCEPLCGKICYFLAIKRLLRISCYSG